MTNERAVRLKFQVWERALSGSIDFYFYRYESDKCRSEVIDLRYQPCPGRLLLFHRARLLNSAFTETFRGKEPADATCPCFISRVCRAATPTSEKNPMPGTIVAYPVFRGAFCPTLSPFLQPFRAMTRANVTAPAHKAMSLSGEQVWRAGRFTKKPVSD